MTDEPRRVKAHRVAVADLTAEQRTWIAWGVAQAEARSFEVGGRALEPGDPELREIILRALHNGAALPDLVPRTLVEGAALEEPEPWSRDWVLAAIEKPPKRGRGRPPKRRRAAFDLLSKDAAVAASFEGWLADFQRDRSLAWLRFEALRLHQREPDADCWRRVFDLNREADRRDYTDAMTALGARPCPPPSGGKGGDRVSGRNARDLALAAVARQHRLEASSVARIVTRERRRRARKSE